MFKLAENDVLFIREGHLNAITEISPNTEGYYIHINSFVLDQVFPNKALLAKFSFSPKSSISGSDMKWLSHCCEMILSQVKTKGSLEIEISLLRAMILKLAESWEISSTTADRQSEITMLFKELLYVNFREQRIVDFYAKALSISENYLNRSVKLITNKPPKQHINELVINHSKLLLRDSGKDISQIAFELNFSDPSYFGRLFKQITGITPSHYRKAIWQDLSEHL